MPNTTKTGIPTKQANELFGFDDI